MGYCDNLENHNCEYTHTIDFDGLGRLNIMDNCHVPDIYKFNSKNVRINILFGLIDSIGKYNEINDTYEICTRNTKLSEDIIYVSRSVGLISSMTRNGDIYIITFEKIKNEHGVDFLKEEVNIRNFFNIVVEPIEEVNYYGFEIDGNRRFVLGDFTVTHNTAISINIACQIKLKTLVIVNKIILMKQWEESILKFCPTAIVQRLTPKSSLENDVDFYIINAINVSKRGKDFFRNIRTCIVDECHLIMAETLSKSLNYVQPRYLIGLSATPYRSDGLNVLLDLYFGKHKIIRTLRKEHIVYKVETGFTPTVELTKNGKINWNTVLESQSRDEDRNQLILNIIQYYSDRIFLVLTKRLEQGYYLLEKLTEMGESVTSLLGDQQEYDEGARILIGTNSKIGTGFDHARLDTLLLAADVEEYFIQYLGRIFRRPDVEPIIFDLVDKNSILKKHFSTRKSIYIESGGKIKNFDKEILK